MKRLMPLLKIASLFVLLFLAELILARVDLVQRLLSPTPDPLLLLAGLYMLLRLFVVLLGPGLLVVALGRVLWPVVSKEEQEVAVK